MTIARIAVWAFIFGIACLTYTGIRKRAIFKKPEAQFAPFPCPYCGTKIFFDDMAHGKYRCFGCERTVIHGRDATAEENAQARKEEAECAAVRLYLRDETVLKRIMDNLRGHDFYSAKFWAATMNQDRVETTIYKRIVNPDPVKPAESETIVLEPVLLGFRMETKAGRMVFYRALFDYIQSNYAEVYEPYVSSDSGVSIGRRK